MKIAYIKEINGLKIVLGVGVGYIDPKKSKRLNEIHYFPLKNNEIEIDIDTHFSYSERLVNKERFSICETPLTDNTGIYYNTETKAVIEVGLIGDEIPNDSTKLKPSRISDIWKTDKWVMNIEAEKVNLSNHLKLDIKNKTTEIDEQINTHKEQLELVEAGLLTKSDLTKQEYLGLLKNKQNLREELKVNTDKILEVSTESDFLKIETIITEQKNV